MISRFITISFLTPLVFAFWGWCQDCLAETWVYEVDGHMYVLEDGADFSNLILHNVRTFATDVCTPHDQWDASFLPGGNIINRCTTGVITPEFRYWCDLTILTNIKFDNSCMRGAILGGVHFHKCSFRGANLSNLKEYSEVINFETYNWLTEFHDCDFTDAIIDHAYLTGITGENFRSTATYKSSIHTKKLVFEYDFKEKNNGNPLVLRDSNLDKTNFKNYEIKNVKFFNTSLKDCDFSGAYLENVGMSQFFQVTVTVDKATWEQSLLTPIPPWNRSGQTIPDAWKNGWKYASQGEYKLVLPLQEAFLKEQLLSTQNYQMGVFVGIRCGADFTGVDFSLMRFTNCSLSGNFLNTNFTDSVITNSRIFGDNFTVDQIKSTWNYKHGRMEGIKLPEEIQQALDAEKEQ